MQTHIPHGVPQRHQLANPRLQAILDEALVTGARLEDTGSSSGGQNGNQSGNQGQQGGSGEGQNGNQGGNQGQGNQGQGNQGQGGNQQGNQQSSQGQQGQSGSGGGRSEEDWQRLQGALDNERSQRKDAEKKAREGKAAQDRVAELENAGKSEVEQAEAKGRREGAAEATKAANGRLVRSEARALAAEQKFRDPAMAVKLLDLAEVSVTDAGEVDTAAITKQLSDLATASAYLVAEPGPGQQQNGGGQQNGGQQNGGQQQRQNGPAPDPTQGSGGGTRPAGSGRGLAEAEKRFGKPKTT